MVTVEATTLVKAAVMLSTRGEVGEVVEASVVPGVRTEETAPSVAPHPFEVQIGT